MCAGKGTGPEQQEGPPHFRFMQALGKAPCSLKFYELANECLCQYEGGKKNLISLNR